MKIKDRLLLRRSSAAEPHKDRRTRRERTRDAARRAAVKDQAESIRFRRNI